MEQREAQESVTRALPGTSAVRILKHSTQLTMSNRSETRNPFKRTKFRARQHLPPETHHRGHNSGRGTIHELPRFDAVPWPLRRCQQGFRHLQCRYQSLDRRTLPHENRRRCTTSTRVSSGMRSRYGFSLQFFRAISRASLICAARLSRRIRRSRRNGGGLDKPRHLGTRLT